MQFVGLQIGVAPKPDFRTVRVHVTDGARRSAVDSQQWDLLCILCRFWECSFHWSSVGLFIWHLIWLHWLSLIYFFGRFCSNKIVTAKFDAYSFIPKNLYQQFQQPATLYFLLIASIQLIPGLSPSTTWSTLLPLCLVLVLNGMKEGFDDWKRKLSDMQVCCFSTYSCLAHVSCMFCTKSPQTFQHIVWHGRVLYNWIKDCSCLLLCQPSSLFSSGTWPRTKCTKVTPSKGQWKFAMTDLTTDLCFAWWREQHLNWKLVFFFFFFFWQVNKRKVQILVGEDFLDGDWSTVIVGDILKVQIDEEFPADLVFLSSSDPQGKH